MESTNGLYKTELINRFTETWADHGDVETPSAEYFHWFNEQRLHSSIGYLPPVEFE